VPQINNLPLTTIGIFIVVSFVWAWLSDGPLHGRRWPFIHARAVITVSFEPVSFRPSYSFKLRANNPSLPQLIFTVLMLKMPLYENIYGRKVVYWLSQAGVSLLSLINKLTLTLLLSSALVPSF
jgi:MFS transporter, ACS family, pantothenate transporter